MAEEVFPVSLPRPFPLLSLSLSFFFLLPILPYVNLQIDSRFRVPNNNNLNRRQGIISGVVPVGGGEGGGGREGGDRPSFHPQPPPPPSRRKRERERERERESALQRCQSSTMLNQ